jgi:NitT/TauT family transport system substrate-binding protein
MVLGPISCLPASASNLLSVTNYGIAALSLPWAVAEQKGFIKQNGVSVDGIVGSNGGGTSIRNFMASGLPFAQVAVTAAVAAVQQNMDVVFVYSAVNNVGDMSWVAPINSPINTISDLKGKTISYTNPRSTTEMIIRLILEKTGLTNAVKLMPSGGQGAGLTLLSQGVVAAADSDEPAVEPPGKFKVVVRVNDYLPDLTWGVGITTRAFAKAHPEVVRGLIKAWRQSVDWVIAHPNQAAKIYSKVFNTNEDASKKIVLSLVASHYFSPGNFNMKGLQTMVRGMKLVGMAKGSFDLDKVIDKSFLPDDLK